MTLREEAAHQSREILGKSIPMLVPAALFVMQQVAPFPRTFPPSLRSYHKNFSVMKKAQSHVVATKPDHSRLNLDRDKLLCVSAIASK